METSKIAIIGAGGIGSYLCRDLHGLLQHDQFGNYAVDITILDDDVVDIKNLKYQNFEPFDLGDPKSEILGMRYDMHYEVERVKNMDLLKNFNVIIAAVDNSSFRKKLYQWSEKNPDAYWIDLRAEGRSIAYFTKHKSNTLKTLISTLPDDSEEGGSCQLAFELERGMIQQGNKIVASMGSQLLLNYYRQESNSAKFIMRI